MEHTKKRRDKSKSTTHTHTNANRIIAGLYTKIPMKK